MEQITYHSLLKQTDRPNEITILILKIVSLLFVVVWFWSVSTVYAQNALTLSVTPSLFQVSAEPGQQWQSSVKMVNTNSYPITVYAEAVNFAPRDEAGHGKFIPVFAELTEGTTLSDWLS